jgi:sugar phosphate isomerase/epimerase
MKNYQRREFIKLSGGLGAALALGGSLAGLIPGTDDYKKIHKFGLQLYTLRDVLPLDPRGVLKQVASFGYRQIESYEGASGMFWGMNAAEFKKYMDELDMAIVSSHCDINKDFEKKAADAASIGMKYLCCPYKGPQKSIDDFKKFADEFNQKGEICRKNGIRFAYHNHDYSFKPMNGELPQDVMMKMTDPALVDFEMDMYWVVAGGQDIDTWLKKYKNRFRLCHIKDRSRSPVADNGKNSVDLGTGTIDWKKILKSAKANGVEYFIVEQEAYPNGSSLEAARVDAVFMQSLSV